MVSCEVIREEVMYFVARCHVMSGDVMWRHVITFDVM